MNKKFFFTKNLINWHSHNARELPWKDTKDPYVIWISEVILQQTRVEQGLPYFHKFIERFPDVNSLASASEDEVLSYWQGLGYYSRARNLHHTAKTIMAIYEGNFPNQYEEIIQLKGIGPYTAAAIASFAFDSAYPVVDGNVLRVLSRFFAIDEPIDKNPAKKLIHDLAGELLDVKNPGTYNQAIMDFGATICKPKSPNCVTCPLMSMCGAYDLDIVDKLPVKAKKLQRKIRFFHYLIIADADQNIVLRKRKENDIWAKLNDFPLIETDCDDPLSHNQIVEKLNEIGSTDLHGGIVEFEKLFCEKHKLTHRDLNINYYQITSDFPLKSLKNEYFLVNIKKVSNFAVPKPIEKNIKNIFSHRI